MTPDDFRATLRSLGLTQAEASAVLGVSDRAIRAWMTGERTVPIPLAKLMRLIASGVITPDQARNA